MIYCNGILNWNFAVSEYYIQKFNSFNHHSSIYFNTCISFQRIIDSFIANLGRLQLYMIFTVNVQVNYILEKISLFSVIGNDKILTLNPKLYYNQTEHVLD